MPQNTIVSTYDKVLIGQAEVVELTNEELAARLRQLGAVAIDSVQADFDRPALDPKLDEQRRAIGAAVADLSDRIQRDAAELIARADNSPIRVENLQAWRRALADEFGRHEQEFHQEGGGGSLLEAAQSEGLFVGDYVKSQIDQQLKVETQADEKAIAIHEANMDSRWADYRRLYPKARTHDAKIASAKLYLLQTTYRLDGQRPSAKHPFIESALDYFETDERLLRAIAASNSDGLYGRAELAKMADSLPKEPTDKEDILSQLLRSLRRNL